MKRLKFYKIAAFTLLIINIITIGFLILHRPSKPGKRLGNNLNMTGEVLEKINQMEQEHHREKRILVDLDLKLHQELFEQLDGQTETWKKNKLAEISANKNKIEEMTFDFFKEVNNLCNGKQKLQLQKTINKRLHHIRPKPKRH